MAKGSAEENKPTAAGMYDYYLGGSHHTDAERAAAEKIMRLSPPGYPNASEVAWSNRGFLQRASQWLATHGGIDQFLDVGAGLPTQANTHDVVRDSNPEACVVYVDNDERAVEEGRQLLGDADGVAYVRGDFRDAASILENPEVKRHIDFTRPVGLLVVGLLYFVADDDGPGEALDRLVDAIPSGSYIALSHATLDNWNSPLATVSKKIYAKTRNPLHHRSRAEVEGFLHGLEILPPYEGAEAGVSYIGLWGAEDPEAADDDAGRMFYAAVARKP